MREKERQQKKIKKKEVGDKKGVEKKERKR